MAGSVRQHGRLKRLVALGLLLVSVAPVWAATELGPAKEKLQYERAPFTVERSATATAEDLGLPFLTEAKLVRGYVYRLSDDKDQPVGYYAWAQLTSARAPEAVAQEYSRQIGSHPKPELVKDKSGTRWVLAVGSATETRVVTIRQAQSGSTIELTRVTKPVELKQPAEDEGPAQPRQPQRPRGPRGPRGPSAPRGGMEA